VARPRDAARTRQRIFRAALAEFSRAGYGGARMDRIAARAQCNVRMIYHHYGKKNELYRIVLEQTYEDIRTRERKLELEKHEPLDGIITLLEFTFDHFRSNPAFVSLLNNENLMRGKFVLKSKKITDMASPLYNAIESLLDRGERAGVFRSGIDPVQFYATIAGLSWFHLSNAYTLSAMFGRDLTDDAWRDERRKHVRQVVRSFLTSSQGDL
jgi:AcrR family transcriptional regulator